MNMQRLFAMSNSTIAVLYMEILDQICSHRLFFHPSNEAFLMNDSSSLYDARFSVARTQP